MLLVQLKYFCTVLSLSFHVAFNVVLVRYYEFITNILLIFIVFCLRRYFFLSNCHSQIDV